MGLAMIRDLKFTEVLTIGHYGKSVICDGCGAMIDAVPAGWATEAMARGELYATARAQRCWRCAAWDGRCNVAGCARTIPPTQS